MDSKKQKLVMQVRPYIIKMLKMYLNKREYLFFVERYGLATKSDLKELSKLEYQITDRQKSNINRDSLIKLFKIPGFGPELYAFLYAKIENKKSLDKIVRCNKMSTDESFLEDPSWWIPALSTYLNPLELQFAIKRYNLDGNGWRSIDEIAKEFNNQNPSLVYKAMENRILSRIFANGEKFSGFYEYLISNCTEKEVFLAIKSKYIACKPTKFNYNQVKNKGIWCLDTFISFKGLSDSEILYIKRCISHPLFIYLMERKMFFNSTIEIIVLIFMLGIVDNISLSPLEISYLLKISLDEVINIIKLSASSFKEFYEAERIKYNFPQSALFLNLASLNINK